MSNAVTATGILIKRGPVVANTTVVLTSTALSSPVGALTAACISAAPHGLTVGDEVTFAGTAGGVPTMNQSNLVVIAVADTTHFTVAVPVTITTGSTGGTLQLTFDAVGELKEVIPGGISRNKIETSTHNDGAESHVLGILRHSDPGMKINYVGTDSTHIAIMSDILNNTKANWKIVFPSGTYRLGLGYVQQFMFDPVPVDAEQGATIAITYASTVTEFAA